MPQAGPVQPRYRVAVDIGGTFTDIVVQDASSGEVSTGKVLSTREDPARAVLTAIERFAGGPEQVEFLVHGTTVGLNAVLERRGARTGLLMTAGFEDAYLIGGNDRLDIFDIRYRKPRPLLEAEQIFAVEERIGNDGEVQRELDLAALAPVVEQIRGQGLESLAVCLLYGYMAPDHELALERHLREELGIPVLLSHRVSPEWREYARASTTVTSAYIAPVIERYLSTLIEQLDQGGGRSLHVMQSNGGVMSAEVAREEPIQTLLSGPVGGAIGAQEISRVLDRPNVVCVDMGGTSFDVSLTIGGEASVSTETEIDGLPLQMSAVDITGIGAGGGSVAWLDGAALRVGPRSAGSEPGPVCYGRGGSEPTVTDANLALGRVNTSSFAGGGMELDLAAAEEALAGLGGELGLSAVETAQGILDIVNAAMADAIRTQTVERGIDPREFALVAYGGAGPMHAAALAEQLEIDEVIVPAHPGTFSAWGMLQTDVRHDLRVTHFRALEEIDVGEAAAAFAALEAQGRELLLSEDVDPQRMHATCMADLRYVGQEYSLRVPVPSPELDPAAVKVDFDRLYHERYGHSSAASPAEVVKLWVTVRGDLPRPAGSVAPAVRDAPHGDRSVRFGGEWQAATVADRAAIAAGSSLAGPAVIEESTSTTVVPPGWSARVVEGGHLAMNRSGGTK
ncbi:MAG TPA: hydantoinase/oxoprolinase family protein [Solirubrobacterales bacterium]|nr:hydantoinase/oxoprolinase family protein [Solirubrobacterales bacterium]